LFKLHADCQLLAVRCASSLLFKKWSNGQVEAQVNCLKLQKRLMFGKANFDLLRLLPLDGYLILDERSGS
jgi:hypothetical protein